MAPDDDKTNTHVTLTSGTMMFHYRIIEKIGSGGMGEIYLAEDTRLNRQVALKFLPLECCRDKEIRTRFQREAQAAAKLCHPNIITIFEVNEFNGRPYFAMEHIQGKSLADFIENKDNSLEKIIVLSIQICEGLSKAHQAGIVHRDIKPSNILIDQDGRAKILDFGLAAIKGEKKLTKTGSTLGTINYMSPEQARGENLDHRSDIFSLGVMLYEMITGHLPFKGEHEPGIIYSIQYDEPEPLARYKSGVSDELQRVIAKALEKDKNRRYQHADELASDLRRLTSAASPQRNRRFRLLSAVLFALIIVAGAYFGYAYILHPKAIKARQPKRLVVLPFTNTGGEDQSYFASGITDEVIQRLSSISGLSVVSRMSAARMKQEGDDIKKIGKDLKAQYILDASARYQISSDGTRRVRLTTQLINVTEDRIVWSETYDTTTADVFNVQASIAEKVAEKMNVVLLPAERKEVWEGWTTSPEAWDLYLRGHQETYRYGGYGEQPLRLGLIYLQKALALDSNFSLAWVEITDVYGRLYGFGFDRTDSIKALCWTAAQKALQLSQNPWIRNWPMERYYAQCAKDWDRAFEHLKEAYPNRENDADYLNYSHHVLRRMGRWQEAYENLSKAIELEPKGLPMAKYDLAWDCIYLRRYEEAERRLKEVIADRPDFWYAYDRLFRLYCQWQGDIEKARKVVAQSKGFIDAGNWSTDLKWIGDIPATEGISLSSMDTLDYHYALGYAYFSQGKRDSARYHFEQMRRQYDERREQLRTNPWLNQSFAIMFAGLGERELALEHMRKAMDLLSPDKDAIDGAELYAQFIDMFRLLGDVKGQLQILDSELTMPCSYGLGWFIIDPDFKPLVLDPEFKSIMEKHADSIQWALYRKRVESH